MKLLFICSLGLQRSPTAAKLFSEEYETEYAGIYSKEKPVTKEKLDWADKIFVMEEEHKIELNKLFKGYKVTVLNISDQYYYGDPNLENILRKKVEKFLN